jgi:hypothetical protein
MTNDTVDVCPLNGDIATDKKAMNNVAETLISFLPSINPVYKSLDKVILSYASETDSLQTLSKD